MSTNAAVQPLLLPDWQRRPEKQRRVYRGPPERRPRHCGGRDNSAGAMGTPNKERSHSGTVLAALEREGVIAT
jgi:hypothetical protein